MAFVFNVVDHLLPPLGQIDEQMLDLPARRQLRFESSVRKLVVMLEGDCFVTLGDRTRWRMKTDDILLVDRTCVQSYSSPDPAKACRLHVVRLVFDARQLPALGPSGRTPRPAADPTRSPVGFIRHHLGDTEILPRAVTPEIRDYLAKIRREVEERPAGYRVAISALCMLMLASLARQRAQNHPPAEDVSGSHRPAYVVTLSMAYITANLSKPIRLEDVAWHVGWSVEHFCRVFRKVTGYSPAQYIRQARIEQAKNRLLGTKDSISQIAAKTGFTSLAVFSRCFRRETGRAPQAYREEKRFGEVVEAPTADYRPVP